MNLFFSKVIMNQLTKPFFFRGVVPEALGGQVLFGVHRRGNRWVSTKGLRLARRIKNLDIWAQNTAWIRRLKTPEKAYQRKLEAGYSMIMKNGSIQDRIGVEEVVGC